MLVSLGFILFLSGINANNLFSMILKASPKVLDVSPSLLVCPFVIPLLCEYVYSSDSLLGCAEYMNCMSL